MDNNYFKNSKDVLGTFYTERGRLLAGQRQHLRQRDLVQPPAPRTNPAGPNPTSNTTVSIPYSYSLDAASCVPDIVSQTAGANKGLQVSNGSCTPHDPDRRPDHPPRRARPRPARPRRPPSDPEPTPSGTNLSIGAGSDGSSKASGTSYGNVSDGNLSTYWSPTGSTGSISIKWGSATTVSTINIREASGAAGVIGSWQVINGDTGAVLASGSGAGVITFPATSLKKVTFEITSSTGTPKVAEFETYAG